MCASSRYVASAGVGMAAGPAASPSRRIATGRRLRCAGCFDHARPWRIVRRRGDGGVAAGARLGGAAVGAEGRRCGAARPGRGARMPPLR